MIRIRTTYWAVLATILCMMISACTQRPYKPTPNEQIYGIWVNRDEPLDKIEMYADGSWKSFIYVDDKSPRDTGTFRLYKKWKDKEGNTWYQSNATSLTGIYKGNMQELDRINAGGDMWEYIYEPVGAFDPMKYPKVLDPESGNYHRYYRSK